MSDDKYFPGLVGAISILIIYFFTEIMISCIFYDFDVLFSSGDPKASVITVISTGIFLTFYNAYSKIPARKLFTPLGGISHVTLLWSFLPVALMIFSTYWWLGPVADFLTSLFPEDIESLIMLENVMRGGFFTFFSLCIVAPLAEELLFRGVILRGLLVHYHPLNAILASSLIFGIAHLNVYQSPNACILGCLLGYIYYISRSLWPSIFAHALWNFMVYVDFLHYESQPDSSPDNESDFIVLFAFFSITILGLYIFYKLFRYKKFS